MTDPVYAPDPPSVAPEAPAFALRDRLLHLLLPAGCLGCGSPLPAKMPPLGLCRACRERLAPMPAEACAVCSRPLVTAAPPPGFRCGPCRESPPAFDRLLALWLYQEPLDAVVRALKFGRLDYLGRHLATALAEGLAEELGSCDLAVPVPLHWLRRLTRGYNQSERIARPLAARLGLPLVPALVRTRSTPPQSRLGKTGRIANLRRAFRARRADRLRDRHVLLIDDVATTGATLDAAAGALKAAGAAAVTAVVAGRTPVRY